MIIKGSNFHGLFIFGTVFSLLYILISFFIYPFEGLFLILLILPIVLLFYFLFRYQWFIYELNIEKETLFIKGFSGKITFDLKDARKIQFVPPAPTYSGYYIAILFHKRYLLSVNYYESMTVEKILFEKGYKNLFKNNFEKIDMYKSKIN